MKKDVKISLMENGKLSRGGWLSIVAFLLVAVIALSVALGLVVKAGKEQKSMEEVSAGGGMVLPEETEGDGISLTSTLIPKEQYEEYGIMPIAETSYSVTATAKAEGVALSVTQQKFHWELAWASANSADVNTFVSLSAEEGARTATVSLLQPFSTQILLKCTWAYNDTQSGSVTIDYAKRFKGFNIQYASSVAKSASDESHLSTAFFAVGDDAMDEELTIHLASPFVDGSWKDGPWNAVIFRVLEPVFDSVGTLENSVVSVSNIGLSYGSVFPETTSTFDHISNQLIFSVDDGAYDEVQSLFDAHAEEGKFLNDDHCRKADDLVPRNTQSFTQIDLLKSCFHASGREFADSVFGTSDSSPSNLTACNGYLTYYNDRYEGRASGIYPYTIDFPNVINLQYGDPVRNSNCYHIFFEVDLVKSVSIDFTKSNFIF